MRTISINFLLNWRATPYHAPLFPAQSKGYFAAQGLKVAITEPNDPSDVTELIGTGRADLGFKAMIHTVAAKARGYPIKSIGSLLDEPYTGIVYLEGSGITNDFHSLRGKRIGYVGEFGRVQIDDLATRFGVGPNEYTTVRCGMNISKAIQRGEIDAGIGLENVQMAEMADWLVMQGRPTSSVKMMRLDELANLGCCCFCTILYIGNEAFLSSQPETVRKFMAACQQATRYVVEEPERAFADLCTALPHLSTRLNLEIFQRSLPYFSHSLHNVERDWVKVVAYSKRLGILDEKFVPNYTNDYLEEGAGEAKHSQTSDTVDGRRVICLG